MQVEATGDRFIVVDREPFQAVELRCDECEKDPSASWLVRDVGPSVAQHGCP
jgi:hypothetical protein